MYSIQAQHSHHVIQQVLNHLDTNNKNTPRVRAGIVQVLLETVAIAAKGSVGPTVLEVFNTLLKHLRMSVDLELEDARRHSSCSSASSGRGKESEERIVQNAIIQTIGTLLLPGLDFLALDFLHHGTKRIQTMLLSSLIMVSQMIKELIYTYNYVYIYIFIFIFILIFILILIFIFILILVFTSLCSM
ncbi:Protein EFR3 A [Liparis tanakae]|uniref:Protein EFR3 A n=1 Tax=Liparis tanakae TaxID=230148 RepID=A0A4Z2EMX7_9TELE|nr:Protein EFR3 A [Liparis tanakae]